MAHAARRRAAHDADRATRHRCRRRRPYGHISAKKRRRLRPRARRIIITTGRRNATIPVTSARRRANSGQLPPTGDKRVRLAAHIEVRPAGHSAAGVPCQAEDDAAIRAPPWSTFERLIADEEMPPPPCLIASTILRAMTLRACLPTARAESQIADTPAYFPGPAERNITCQHISPIRCRRCHAMTPHDSAQKERWPEHCRQSARCRISIDRAYRPFPHTATSAEALPLSGRRRPQVD